MFREGNKKLFPEGQKAFKLTKNIPKQFQLISFLACSRLMSSGWLIPSFIKGHFSLPAAGYLHLKSLLSVFCLGWNKQVHKCTLELINEWIFQYLIRPSVCWPVVWDKFSLSKTVYNTSVVFSKVDETTFLTPFFYWLKLVILLLISI